MEKLYLFFDAPIYFKKKEGMNMPEKKTKTEAQIRAQKKYMENFVEIKVRMTADKRTTVQEHAASMGESATAFINRAIDETMERDSNK